MKFNLDNYKAKNYCMHCKTMEEAENFCQVLNENRRTWTTGQKYINHTNWDVYRDKTVYYFNKGTFDRVLFAQNTSGIILEWSDFMENKDDCVICNTDGLWDLAGKICDDMGLDPGELINIFMTNQDCIYSNIRDYLEKLNYCPNCGRKRN